jgi:hypothetical protein
MFHDTCYRSAYFAVMHVRNSFVGFAEYLMSSEKPNSKFKFKMVSYMIKQRYNS